MARHFQNWLKAYIQHTRDSESPDEFHFWTGVWTLAGALRRRVWIDMRKFQWTPNFYIILVGPPGIVAKSTTANVGQSLLKKVKGINFGPQSATWQALTVALEQAQEYVQLPTGENIPMSAVNLNISELGTLMKMDDTALADVMISLWDGQLGEWGHNTKTTGNTKIENPWINMIGATTPSWLQNNFPEHMIGGGLTSRIVFVYGESKRHLIAYPDEVVPSKDYYDHERLLLEDLQEIALLVGAYTISPEARVWGRDWYARLWSQRDLHMASERYSGYIARKQTHMHKLAIILSAAKRSTLTIEREDLEEADKLLGLIEHHMIKVFESVGVVDEARHVKQLCAFVQVHQWISGDDLRRATMTTMSSRDFIAALQAAKQNKLIEIENRVVNGAQVMGFKHVQRTIN